MGEERDPIERSSTSLKDSYDITTWEQRNWLDTLSVLIYKFITNATRAVTVAVAFVLLLLIVGVSTLTDPQVGILTALSAVPALGLAAYVWHSDVTGSEPISLLVATFLLGVLMANFAAVANSFLKPYFRPLAFAGSVVFFFLVVGPVEETVKLLAVRLHAYRSDNFDAVLDGAVYGAMSGLGFAFIENALYISRQVSVTELDLGLALIGLGGGIVPVRALVGPGHVIYSAFAGYYLGLAKFNSEDAGPIVIKGLIIAATIHATYNSTVGIGTGLLSHFLGLPSMVAFILFIVLYDGFFGYLLYRKIKQYRNAYRTAHEDSAEDADALSSSLEEYERGMDEKPIPDRG
jgi:RsiW-degrading membrane proteinase PrsW (M82 family)